MCLALRKRLILVKNTVTSEKICIKELKYWFWDIYIMVGVQNEFKIWKKKHNKRRKGIFKLNFRAEFCESQSWQKI